MPSNVILDKNGVRIAGRYTLLLCASLFYFRIPPELWRDRIRRVKASGYNCVDVYFPWNYHELSPGKWDFSEGRDAGAFLDMLAEEGLYVVARPGPYICSEWDGGAIPAWVLASGMRIRENGRPFMRAVRKWYKRILPVIAAREQGRGGSVILVQLDNELDFFDCRDSKAYIGALARSARSMGVKVPLFGCAGQCDATGATGFASGVCNTYNFYPSPVDPHFDSKCRLLSQMLAKIGQPLLITETNREHFLLRRELISGAKLLGAYNQAGGSNFGFTNSVNNWGTASPLSFIASDYDFRSMLSAAGEFGPEAFEGRLLRGLMDALGEGLAAALPAEDAGIAVECTFPTSKGGAGALALSGGGMLLCVPNLSGGEGEALVRVRGLEFRAVVGAFRSPLYPVGVPLGKTGMPGILKYATAEILAMEEGALLLYADGPAEAVVEPEGGQPVRIASPGGTVEDGRGGRLEVRILKREEAARREPGGRWEARIACSPAKTEKISAGRLAEYEPAWSVTPESEKGTMEAHGIYRGFALYEAHTGDGQAMLVRGAADIITAYDGPKRLDTRVSGGQWQLYPGGGEKWRFRAECWGHSNFDDSRLDSMRIAGGKGIKETYAVLREETLAGRWRFRLMDEWMPKKLRYRPGPFDAILDLNAWNTTRKPVIALYYTDVRPQPGCDGMAVRITGGSAEVAIYAGGAFIGAVNPLDPWVYIPSGRLKGKYPRLELLCRKRDWNEPVGEASLFHLKRLKLRVYGFGEEGLARMDAAPGRDVSLPVRFDGDRTWAMEFDMDGRERACAYVRVDARDLKVTAVFNGRVVGRVFGEWEGRPFIAGGDGAKFYLPGPWYRESGNRLALFIEPTGREPELRGLTVEYADL
jgi:beta-galactosidase